MEANNHIKSEPFPENDELYADTNDMEEEQAQYKQYEADMDNDYLIEYVEEEVEDYAEEAEQMRDQIKTHTLSIRSCSIDGGEEKEVYRCLECDINFATVEDFTKVHREMKKRQQQNIMEKEDRKVYIKIEQPEQVQYDAIGSVQTQAQEEWGYLKEEQNVVEMYTDNEQEVEYMQIIENNVTEEECIENEDVENMQYQAMPANVNDDCDNNDENDGEKFFCCDCQLIFSDLTSAEEHVCSAINADETNNSAPNIKSETVVAVGQEEVNLLEQQQQQLEYDDDNNAEQFVLLAEERPKVLQTTKENRITALAKYHCQECDKKFTSLQGLHVHMRSHKANKTIKQSQSNLQFIAKTKNTATICNVCNTTFSSLKNLKLHQKIHKAQELRSIEQALPAGAKKQYTDMNKFFCEICNKSFEQHLLGIHKNMHLQTEEYRCGICNRHFENKTSHEMHMRMHAERPAKPRKPQAKATALENGGDSEAGGGKKEGRFPCQYCGHTFQRPFEKVRHERIHTGEKPYACEVCGKTFRVPYSLTLHLRTHTDIRPYVCATCNKRFKAQTVYTQHLRTHLAERAYKCETCGKAFRTSVQLAAHRNIHSKPYNCPVCSRPFSSLYYVKVHMKTHSKQNRSGDTTKYSCYVCGALYARLPALRTHLKELHLYDIDTNETIDLGESDMFAQQGVTVFKYETDDDNIDEEHHVDAEADDDDDVVEQQLEEEEEHEIDEEAALLIAAAAEADCAAYIEAATVQSTDAAAHVTAKSMQELNGQMHGEYEVNLSNDELIVDNYQTEEVVTDWLAK